MFRTATGPRLLLTPSCFPARDPAARMFNYEWRRTASVVESRVGGSKGPGQMPGGGGQGDEGEGAEGGAEADAAGDGGGLRAMEGAGGGGQGDEGEGAEGLSLIHI